MFARDTFGKLLLAAWIAITCASAWPGAALAVGQGDAPNPEAESPAPANQPPRVLSRTEPEYPPGRLSSEHGTHERLPELDVELDVGIDASGAVTDVKVIASGGRDFDEQAMLAVWDWTFAPALKDGTPVPSRMHVPLHFEPPPHAAPEPVDVSITARRPPPSRGAGDHRIDVGALDAVPRASAAKLLELAPSVFLLKDGGGEGHAERVYLRGFDAREGQDIEFSVGGVPINESGNHHGSGYADLNFIIPELVLNLRVVEGPFDPRQGNYAVAGSAEYDLGLRKRGLTAKATYGAFQTTRLLVMWGPEGESDHTYGAAEIHRTDGFGENRDAWRARALGQYEGRLGESGSFRVAMGTYVAEYHSAGLLREADVASGKKGFYDTYDTNQGGSASRFHTSVDFETRQGGTVFGAQVFGIYRAMRLRENYTGFLLDEQLARQAPHPQRGDGLDLSNEAGTFGLRGFGRQGFELLGQRHEIELGLYGRGDVVSSVQQRIDAATAAPYSTEANLASILGDVGLYADASVRFTEWLALRGGLRADLFTYQVDDLCAVKDVSRPSPEDPPGDASCLSSQRFGAHREPNQRSSTATIRPMPRVSALLGPFAGFSLSLAYGQGVRSIDPSYVTQDVETPFAAVDAVELGTSFSKSFEALAVAAQSVFFMTHVDRDQIFSESEGRATLATGTTRLGWAGSARGTGDYFDASVGVSLVRSRFDDTGLLVPYVPDVVVRHDGALFHDLFDIDESPVVGTVGLGLGLVGRRALPFGQRSDAIFTLDASAALAWRFMELEVQGTNLLDLEYRQSEFNFASDFDRGGAANLVPARHFAAGPPLGIFVSLSGTLGGS